jgi:hypothetical protein
VHFIMHRSDNSWSILVSDRFTSSLTSSGALIVWAYEIFSICHVEGHNGNVGAGMHRSRDYSQTELNKSNKKLSWYIDGGFFNEVLGNPDRMSPFRSRQLITQLKIHSF